MMTKPTWRLIDSGPADGFTNMAIDEAILAAVNSGDAAPTLRFYAWQPACLSIGAFQSVNDDIDTAACLTRGIDWVRRPTGGRAILHDREVTYSVAALQNDQRVSGDVMQSYRRISAGLLAGLALLGIEADLAPSAIEPTPGSPHKPAACFAAPSQHEIMAGGRKLIGSAQRRHGPGLLQHGSILLDLDADALMRLLSFTSEDRRQTMAARVRSESVTLSQLLGPAATYESIVAVMIEGFASALDVGLVRSGLTPWEQQESQRLTTEKYQSHDWLYRK